MKYPDINFTEINSLLITGASGCGKSSYAFNEVLPCFLNRFDFGIVFLYRNSYSFDLMKKAAWCGNHIVKFHFDELSSDINLKDGRKHILVLSKEDTDIEDINCSHILNMDFLATYKPFIFIDETNTVKDILNELISAFKHKVVVHNSLFQLDSIKRCFDITISGKSFTDIQCKNLERFEFKQIYLSHKTLKPER